MAGARHCETAPAILQPKVRTQAAPPAAKADKRARSAKVKISPGFKLGQAAAGPLIDDRAGPKAFGNFSLMLFGSDDHQPKPPSRR
jgi:hypothetical protein